MPGVCLPQVGNSKNNAQLPNLYALEYTWLFLFSWKIWSGKIEFNLKVKSASHEFRDMLRILKYHVIFLEFKDETYEHECQSVGGTFFTLLTDQSKPARETDTPVQRIQGIKVKPMQSSIWDLIDQWGRLILEQSCQQALQYLNGCNTHCINVATDQWVLS